MKKLLYIFGGIIILIIIIAIASSGEKKETTPEQQFSQEQTDLQETSQILQKEQKESDCNPSQEICDGIDNDCDELIDENLTQQCGTSNVGVCKFGTQTCQNGNWKECIGSINSTTEICDQIDNDCDGQIDENSVCVKSTWHTITTFSGSSNKTTPTFSITGNQWRIKWDFQATDSIGGVGKGVFGASIYKVGESVSTEFIYHSRSSANDITYIYEKKGDFYIRVTIANTKGWSITVEDFY